MLSLNRHIFGTFRAAFLDFDIKRFYTTTSIRFLLDTFFNFSKDKCKISLMQVQGEYDDWGRIDKSRPNSVCHLIFAICIDAGENKKNYILVSGRKSVDNLQL